MSSELTVEQIERAWREVQQALNTHHRFWGMFSACTSGTRPDARTTDLHDEIVALGNAAEMLRRHRTMFSDATQDRELDADDVAQAVTDCESARHLLGRSMAHLAFRALVERLLAAPDATSDGGSATAHLIDDWTRRTPQIVEPSLVSQLSLERAGDSSGAAEAKTITLTRRGHRARAVEREQAAAARMARSARRVERILEDGSELRTSLEVLINENPDAPDLVPFSVLCESAAQGEIAGEPFRRAVARHAARLRERAELERERAGSDESFGTEY